MFTSKSPVLNLHGETRDTTNYLLASFLNDNYKLKIEYIGVIHGRSSDILKKHVHDILKKDKRVAEFYVSFGNPGITIIKLKIK